MTPNRLETGSPELRHVLLALVVLGALGLEAELLLIGHVEEWTQWVPVVVLAAGLAGAALLWLRPARWSVALFRACMLATLLAGVAGLWLHFTGNREFELEMDAELSGWLLVWHSLRGATPALAPGAMIQLGLLGLVLTWHHPASTGDSQGRTT